MLFACRQCLACMAASPAAAWDMIAALLRTCRRQHRAASIRFCARVEGEVEHLLRYRLLLLPPGAAVIERLLQHLPEVCPVLLRRRDLAARLYQ